MALQIFRNRNKSAIPGIDTFDLLNQLRLQPGQGLDLGTLYVTSNHPGILLIFIA
jgi:hypothetical protein